MTSNHEEYRNDIALENLKCSLQICSGCTYLCSKSSKKTWGS